ncbi:MAG: DUF554 domain-containing protein [candidate division Zixibacteria bacterium]|nr:DUF554 domain-containing protein [candidate division Zixibacteria bacterium]
MVGFFVNTVTVTAGSIIGLLVGTRLKDKYKTIVLNSLGLVTIIIGVRMAVRSENTLILVASLVVGGLIGEWFGIEKQLERFAEYLKRKAGSSAEQFVLGFVTASLLFCIGPMTVVGSFEDGLYNKGELIYIKSLMDGFAAIALTAAFGVGVMFSAIVVFVYQGSLTFAARYLQPFLSDSVVNEMSAAGGVIVIGIAVNVLGLAKIKVGNLILALPLAAVIAALAIH